MGRWLEPVPDTTGEIPRSARLHSFSTRLSRPPDRAVLSHRGNEAWRRSCRKHVRRRNDRVLECAGHHRSVWLAGRVGRYRDDHPPPAARQLRSDEITSELQSLMRTSYADFFLKK